MRLHNELLVGINSPAGSMPPSVTGVDASVNITSPQVLVTSSFGYNIQIIITGTVVGVLKLQGSSDPAPPGQNFDSHLPTVVNWTDIKDSSQNVTGAGSVVYDVANSFYNWVRVVYTASSGTGTMSMRINTKGF